VMDGMCQADTTCPTITLAVGPNASGDQYACILVNSGLIPRAKNDTNHPETNRILVNEVDVEVLDGNGAVVDSFTRAVNGVVEPHAPAASGDTSLSVPVMRTESATSFGSGAQIVVGIIIKGRTTGGIDIETPEFYISAEGRVGGRCPSDAMTCC
jgi:hypothetical protein